MFHLQVLSVQPITITADGQLQLADGQHIDPSQVQIVTGDQQIFENNTLSGTNLEQIQVDGS